MDFAEFFCAIGAVAIVGFILNILTKRNKNRRELSILTDCVEKLLGDIDKISEEAEKNHEELQLRTSDFLKKADSLNKSLEDSMIFCDEMMECTDRIIEKIRIMVDFFSDTQQSDDESYAKCWEYIKLVDKDISELSYIRNKYNVYRRNGGRTHGL